MKTHDTGVRLQAGTVPQNEFLAQTEKITDKSLSLIHYLPA